MIKQRKRHKPEALYKISAEWRKDFVTAIWLSLVIIIMVLYEIGFFAPLINGLTGQVVKEEVSTYSQDLNMSFEQSSDYLWVLEEKGELRAVMISGKIVGDGFVKVYLEDKLIFDNTKEQGLETITGYAVGKEVVENVSNETIVENITKLNVTINETIENITIEENITEESNVSKELNITEDVVEEIVFEFEDECLETCSLVGLTEDSYTIRIEVENATLVLDSISYIVMAVEEVQNEPPVFIFEGNLSLYENEAKSFDLEQFFMDPENDSLTFLSTKPENLGAFVDYKDLVLTPEENFTGKSSIKIYASDGTTTVTSPDINIFVLEKPEIEIIENITNVSEINVTEINVSELNVTNVSVVNVTNVTIANVTIENITKEVVFGQQNAVIGEPVRWVKEIVYENKEGTKKEFNTSVDLPNYAENVSVFDVKLKKKLMKDKLKFFKNKIVFDDIVEVNDSKLYFVEYYTEPPQIKEEFVDGKKLVTVYSDVNYTNILTYTQVDDVVEESITLYWYASKEDYARYILENESRLEELLYDSYKVDITNNVLFNVSFVDENNNSLVDKIEWITPHLSNQSFEISITILNPYTYVRDYENWTVAFNTTGTADLIINSTNAGWTEFLSDNNDTFDEMEFLEIRCGNVSLNNDLVLIGFDNNIYNYNDLTYNDSVDVKQLVLYNYSCGDTGYITNFMHKAGYAILQFNFGGLTAYAYDAENMTITEILSPNPTSTNSNVNVYGHVNLSNGTDVANTSIEIYLNGSLINVTDGWNWGDGWWDCGWKYKKQINITNNAAQTLEENYSINLTIDTTGANFLDNGDDLRIVYWNGTTNTEIDRINETAFDSSNTQIWFSLQENISANNESGDYWMYYGNPSASSPRNNKSNVYLFWDDFESGNLDKWDSGTTAKVIDDSSNKVLWLNATNITSREVWKTANWTNLIVSSRAKYLQGSGPTLDWLRYAIRLRTTGNQNQWYLFGSMYNNGTDHRLRINNTDLGSGNYNIITNVWYNYSFSANGSNLTGYVNGGSLISVINTTFTQGGIKLLTWDDANASIYVDDVIVRKYMSPEPTQGITGSEQFVMQTDSNGDYNYTFTAPSTAGTYPVLVNITYNGIYGNNTQNLTVDAGPSINAIECEINTSNNWLGCGNATAWNTIIRQIRVNCTNGTLTTTNVTYNLTNIPDANTTINAGNASSVSGDWWIYDNTDLNITDSGDWNLTVKCIDSGSSSDTESVNWSVAWGVLVPYIITGSRGAQNNSGFTFTAGVNCTVGECGNINATLDPYKLRDMIEEEIRKLDATQTITSNKKERVIKNG